MKNSYRFFIDLALKENVLECNNAIEIYENIPYCYDAWEISEYYKDKCKPLYGFECVKVEICENFAQIVVE